MIDVGVGLAGGRARQGGLREYFWRGGLLGGVICAASRVQVRSKWSEGSGIAGSEREKAGTGDSEQEISVRAEGDG